MCFDVTWFCSLSVEGAGSVMLCWGDFSWQMCRDRYCPFRGVINYGRVWRKGGKRLGLWVPGCQLPKHFSKSERHSSYFMPKAWRLFALFSSQAKNKAVERKTAQFQTISWDVVMAHGNWWQDASAVIKRGKLVIWLLNQTQDCCAFHQTTSQHSASWWSDLGASHQSAQSLMAVKPEACEEKGMA